MDLTDLARRLGLDGSKHIVRQAAELRRMCDVKFDSSVIGVIPTSCGLDLLYSVLFLLFNKLILKIKKNNNKDQAIKLSGMSEKAYIWSFNALHHGLGVVMQLDIRKLGIQFGCVRLIPIVKRGLLQYKNRFMASLPASRKECADFTRPVFTAVAFYLCAKKQKLKVDKMKLIELCGTSEAEFSSVSNSMQELCFEIFGSAKEKKDPREIKGNRDLLDALPGKRKIEDGGYFSDEDNEHSSYQKRKIADMGDYDEWKSTVLATNKQTEAKAHCKPAKQLQLNFGKDVVKT
ncbi:hypothetical protein QQ045_032853 [Rhodiola kirilowii]